MIHSIDIYFQFPTMFSQTTIAKKARTPTTKQAKRSKEETFCPEVENCFNEIADDGELLQRDKQSSPQITPQESTFYEKNGLARKRSHSIANKLTDQPLKPVSHSETQKCSCHSDVASDVYEFSEVREESEPSKKQRRIKQPKKRSKPAPWPRIKTPSTIRREKVYTVGRKKEGTLTKMSTTNERCAKPADNPSEMMKITENIAKINEQAARTPNNSIRKSHSDFVKPPVIPPKISDGKRKSMKLYSPVADDWDEDLVTSSNCLVSKHLSQSRDWFRGFSIF